MSSLPTDDEILIKDTSEVRTDATISIILIVSLTVLFVGYYIYSQYVGINNTVYVRLKQFYGSSLSQLSLGLVIVFLVSDVINTFNKSIILPIIQSSFPDENMWNQGVSLPRGQIMYPGMFLQSVVSFVLSIGIMFMVGEMLNTISKLFSKKDKKSSGTFYINLAYIFVIIIFITILIWNIIEITNPAEEGVIVNFQSPRFRMNSI
jgi:large-conductance mechanosensitive channel